MHLTARAPASDVHWSNSSNNTWSRLEDPPPWSDPVSAQDLLVQLRSTLVRHMVLPPHADVALSLWALGTHVFDAFAIFPRLLLSSPMKRCGKTTAMELLILSSARAIAASNVSAAALFRAIEVHRPTIFIDEADTFLARSESLRGVINSGHSRTSAYVLRADGSACSTVSYSTWAPVAIAMIGKPPSTIVDRSIEIELSRKALWEVVEPLHREVLDAAFETWRRKATRWAQDDIEALRTERPDRPEGLDDRAADNWAPLLAIAERAGGEWPRLASSAATAISRERAGEEDIAMLLLADIRALFHAKADGSLSESAVADRLTTSCIVEGLRVIEDRPWKELQRGRPITAWTLARLLKPFKVFTADQRVGSGPSRRTYLLSSFQEAFQRYLPPPQTSIARKSMPDNA